MEKYRELKMLVRNELKKHESFDTNVEIVIGKTKLYATNDSSSVFIERLLGRCTKTYTRIIPTRYDLISLISAMKKGEFKVNTSKRHDYYQCIV